MWVMYVVYMSYMGYVNDIRIFMDRLKSLIFCLKKKCEVFCQHVRMKNLNYKNENIERKYLKNMQKKLTFKGNK